MQTPRFRASLQRPNDLGAEIAWLAFRGGELLVRAADEGHRYDVVVAADLGALGVRVVRTQALGELDSRPCCSAELAEDTPVPSGHAYVSLRRLHGHIDPELFDLAGTAYQVQYWDKAHQFCAACGAGLALSAAERAKACPQCAATYFPRVTPAVISLVEDGPRILMTRQPRFPPGMYGLVAGFVDPGETLEACVAREVREETGIEIADIRYFGSQPWPFPHQIMIGFTARATGGELHVDTSELEDARFFERGALPPLPPPISIARKLVDAWLAR